MWFTAAVLIMIAVQSVAIVLNINSQNLNADVRHTQDILRAANRIDKSISNIALASRNYVLSNDESAVAQIPFERKEIHDALESLRGLVKGHVGRTRSIREIGEVLGQYQFSIDGLQQSVARNDTEAAETVIQQGQSLVNQAKARIRTFMDAERSTMRDDQACAADSASLSLITTIVGTALSLVAIAAVVVMLSRESDALAKAQKELLQNEIITREIFDNATQGISLRDLHGRFQVVNAALLKWLGKSREEVVGHTEAEVLRPTSAALLIPIGERAAREDRVIEETVEVPGPSGPRTYVIVRFPVRDPNGTMMGIGGVSTDVSEMANARHMAEEASASKSEFLSRMSHELRTPLNAIIGFAQLLEMYPELEKHRDKVKHILDGGRHLLDLINEVLDIGRIEAGMLSLSPEAVSAREIIDEVMTLVNPIARNSGISIKQETAGSDLLLYGDRQRIRQVLINLVTNGIKYNVENGQVTIRATERDGAVRIEVVDTGQGVPAALVDRLFTPFDRLGAESQKVEGTGLGLALSKMLMSAMDGALGYHPAEPRGSVFWIELPRCQGAAPASSSSQILESSISAFAEERTVLYIEDNLANVQLIKTLFETMDRINLIVAMNGRQGITLASESVPDLVLLDLHLPDMDGEEVMNEVRRLDKLRSVPIIIISADATERQIRRLIDKGAFAYVTKPFDLKELLARVDEALAGKDPQPQ